MQIIIYSSIAIGLFILHFFFAYRAYNNGLHEGLKRSYDIVERNNKKQYMLSKILKEIDNIL